jgi:endonuclease/exonuclease/phosphatase family metal-dependent hydrolase
VEINLKIFDDTVDNFKDALKEIIRISPPDKIQDEPEIIKKLEDLHKTKFSLKEKVKYLIKIIKRFKTSKIFRIIIWMIYIAVPLIHTNMASVEHAIHVKTLIIELIESFSISFFLSSILVPIVTAVVFMIELLLLLIKYPIWYAAVISLINDLIHINESFDISSSEKLKTVINILSWNLCWGCMEASKNSKNDTTAKQLAEKCYSLKGACLNNVAKSIDKNYDFICLQEATNWGIIYGKLNMPHLSFVHNSLSSNTDESLSELVTFYDNRKYRLLSAKCGNISNASDRRPYQILVFKIIQTDYNIIVINLHNKQNCSQTLLEKALSRDLENMIKISSGVNFENIQNMQLSKIDTKILHNAKVIMIGDFNDNENQNFWKGIEPFKYSDIPEIENIVVSSQGIKPPKTCCTPSNLDGYYDLRENKKNYDIYLGDYILISDNLEYEKSTRIKPDFEVNALTNPTSDHLPVETEILI